MDIEFKKIGANPTEYIYSAEDAALIDSAQIGKAKVGKTEEGENVR